MFRKITILAVTLLISTIVYSQKTPNDLIKNNASPCIEEKLEFSKEFIDNFYNLNYHFMSEERSFTINPEIMKHYQYGGITAFFKKIFGDQYNYPDKDAVYKCIKKVKKGYELSCSKEYLIIYSEKEENYYKPYNESITAGPSPYSISFVWTYNFDDEKWCLSSIIFQEHGCLSPNNTYLGHDPSPPEKKPASYDEPPVISQPPSTHKITEKKIRNRNNIPYYCPNTELKEYKIPESLIMLPDSDNIGRVSRFYVYRHDLDGTLKSNTLYSSTNNKHTYFQHKFSATIYDKNLSATIGSH